MSLISISIAFATVACISFGIGLLSRRVAEAYRPIGFVWAIATSMGSAIPILLSSNLTDVSRIIRPREAIDWLPVGLIALASLFTLAMLMHEKYRFSMLALAGLVCLGLAGRMLYGGIYFRVGTFEPTSAAWSLLWGGAIAICWLVSKDRMDASSWGDFGPWLVLIGALVPSLAMSGSIVYGAIAGLLWVALLLGWLGSARLTAFVSVPATVLVGLGIAYAELSFLSGAMLTLAMFMLSSKSHLQSRRLRIVLVVVGLALATTGVGLVASKFIDDTSSTGNSYGAYK